METSDEPPPAAVFPLVKNASREQDGDGYLPEPDSPYRAYAGISPTEEKSVTFLMANGRGTSIPYGRLVMISYRPADGQHGGERLSIRFDCIGPLTVILEGRDLRPAMTRIGQHRLSWLREWPHGPRKADGVETVISRITIKEVPDTPLPGSRKPAPAGS